MNNKQTVVVAMSGGVDSSVAAKLLLDQGYNVIGLTLRLWGAKISEQGVSIAESDAACVAKILGIEHHVFDCSEYFYNTVVQNFVQEYELARTPNPCVYCNKIIKFGLLFEQAMKLGADFLATGHYVQKYVHPSTNIHYLQTATDLSKDQTYVLYNISHDKLAKCIFPLGKYSKPQVRKLAKEYALPVFNKPDSQEICFVPNDDYRSFIAAHGRAEIKIGKFVNPKGEVMGEHQGLLNYTIGQRKGFNMGFGKRVYVVKLDKDKNQVVLGDDNEVFASRLQLKDLIFVDGRNAQAEYNLMAKIRYNAKPAPATVIVMDDRAEVIFDQPQRAITPGQSVAFYEDNVLVGGGVIE